MLSTQKSVDPSGFRRLAKAAEINSRQFRDAAASTGLFETQQVRVNAATDEYVKKLNAQKIGFREMIKQRKIATAAYREQLAMEQMIVRQNPASSLRGKQTFDVIWPKEYEKNLDTAGRRLSWFNEQLKSGATQMVNWGKNTQWAGRQLMVGFTMPIAAFGAAAGVMAYQVDKEFTRIAKVYDTQASRAQDLAAWEKETAELRAAGYDTARMAAREYQAAINDTLNVQAELAATGQTGFELQKNTAEIMRISTLGELEHNVATEAAIALQQIWQMNSQELADTFNYLNATENATSLATEDFAIAIPVASAAVKAFGGDIKELGILMTAMKERGINASEGANALKATMQRLSRPSKQVQEEFEAMTGKSIVELVDSSNGLIDIFTKLNAITKNLGDDAKRDVFAGLFGSYQVARMTALAEGMGQLQEGTGQVSEAARVAGLSTEQWAETAQTEIEALQQSVSGRFKAALEEIKIVMGEMGMPFLEAGTQILETLAKIIGAVNDMPDLAKKILGWSVAIAAVAGPVVMLAGLFGNLFGNGIKAVAGMITMFGRLTGSMTIADRESRIYAAAAKMAETQHLANTRAVTSLNATMEKLVAAQQAATTASQKEAAAMGVSMKMSAARKKIEDERIRQMQIENRLLQEHAILTKNDRVQYWGTDRNGQRRQIGEAAARAQAAQYIDDRNAAYITQQQQATAVAAQVQAKAAKDEAASRAKTKVLAAGAAVSTAAMSASMATMMFSSNETANNIAKWVMIGSVAVPAAMALGKALAAAGTAATVLTAKLAAMNTTAMLSRASFAGMGKALVGMVGLGGLVGVGIAAIGTAAYFTWKHFNDIKKEQEEIDRNNAKLLSQTERWAQASGKALDGYRKLAAAQRAGANDTDITDRVEFYRSDDEKDATKAFTNMDGASQNVALMGKYIDMVEGAGMSQAEATKEIQAFLVATGETYTYAAGKAEMLADSIGRLGKSTTEWAGQFSYAVQDIYRTGIGDNNKEVTQLGAQAGKYFSQGFLTGTTSERENMRKELENQIARPWEALGERLASSRPAQLAAGAFIADATGVSAEAAEAQVQKMMDSGIEFRNFYMGLSTEMREEFRRMNPSFAPAIEEAEALERIVVGGIAEALGVAGKDVDTLGELFDDAAVKAQTLGTRIGEWGLTNDGIWQQTTSKLDVAISDIGQMYRDVMGEVFDPSQRKDFEAMLTEMQNTDTSGMSEEEKQKFEEQQAALEKLITTLYVYKDALGIQDADSEFGLLINTMGGFQIETDEATGKVQRLKGSLDGLSDVDLSIDVMVNMMQDIRGGIQQDMADMMTADFDNRMDADIEATQTYWDNRKSALDSEMDRRSAGLDAKWEKRKDGAEKYWEGRIDQVEKAIEAEEKAEDKRQKMFEAEMDRMERLNDARNKNIDFNIALNEGRLDEAAQIANDIQAGESKGVFDRAADASQGASDKRVDRLEDRKEDIEAQKDAAMKAMDAREKAEKAHLDKVSDMRKKALEADAKAAMEAKQEEWDTRKQAFEDQMALFLAFTARNDKELKAHMEDVGISYEKFGGILKAKGTDWSTYMGREMKERVRLAALELRNDAAWSQLGEGAVDAMITAMGFKSKAQFQHFIKTGEMKDLMDGDAGAASTHGNRRNKNKEDEMISNHEGGWAGTNNSRKGVARTTKGLHSSELLIRAQNGEYIVDRKNAANNSGILEAISGGAKFGTDSGTGGEPMAGVVAGGLLRSMMFGIMKNVKRKADVAKAYAAAKSQIGSGSGGFDGAGYVPGVGGWRRPSVGGYQWGNTHDYQVPVGTPIYAISDGVITDSRAITSGGSPGNGTIAPNGQAYRSYGETIAMRDASGNIWRAAHLSARYVGAGQEVKGGALLGRSGITGNSSGPHVHWDVNGNYNASGYLASRGIPLRDGAANVRFDNTLANLHHGERVLTKSLTSDMDAAMREYFANGGQTVYDIDINGEGLDTDAIVTKVVQEIDKRDARKPQSRTIGKRRS